jgi:hypothetical protein
MLVLHHFKQALSSRVIPVNEEITEVEFVPEEEPTSVEVGFDICGTDREPELPVDQGKPCYI